MFEAEDGSERATQGVSRTAGTEFEGTTSGREQLRYVF
jgi:hypothetical protein